jgi:putative ABC transport system permease protein
MKKLRALWLRLHGLFGSQRHAADIDAELQSHLAMHIDDNLRSGMTPQEARRQALIQLGGLEQTRQAHRDRRTLPSVESLIRDVRYGLRTLTRTPGFTIIAILIMALGIGANVALFTVVRSMLLNPLPYRDSGRLVSLYEREEGNHHTEYHQYLPVDAGSFFEWQHAAQAMAEMAMVSPWQNYNVSAEGGKLPERVDAGWVSWNFFPLLGVQPALGRTFSAEDDRPDAQATVLLSYSLWKRRYAADPGIVGKTILLDARPYTAIGVLPASFVYTSNMGGNTIQVWTPVRHEAPHWLLTTYQDHEFLVLARLREGAGLPRLIERLAALQKQIIAAHASPSVHGGVQGRSMLDDVVANYKTPLYALLVATGCVLLIACMNVASLLVARTASRSRELAIRAALGGSRMRLLRERMVETLLLSAAGGALGLLFAWAALQWLMSARSTMNRIEAIHVDGVVTAFTVAIVALCALFSGLISAMGSGGHDILSALRESSRGHSAGTARARMRRTLLVFEVALTVILLVGAGLLLKSYQRLRSADLGVPEDNVLTLQISLPDARYKDRVQIVAFFEQLIARVRALPGVQSAGLVSKAPGEGWGGDDMMSVVEHPPLPRSQVPDMMIRGADPGYFSAIGIPLLRGRLFTADERLDRANVAVISKTAAHILFGDEDPIGRHLQSQTRQGTWQIIGVVGDTRWTVSLPAAATMYWPIYGNDYSVATIVVRAPHNVESLALPIQKLVGQLDPDLPVSDVMTLRQAIGKSTIDSAFDSILILAFAVIALLLAAAGLYGVLSYLVTQRTTEIGIRIALGAERHQMLQLMLADGLWPALFGLALGLVASMGAVRLILSMLYDTEPLDPAVFGIVALTLMLVAALACLIPAWRASRLDPAQALRSE